MILHSTRNALARWEASRGTSPDCCCVSTRAHVTKATFRGCSSTATWPHPHDRIALPVGDPKGVVKQHGLQHLLVYICSPQHKVRPARAARRDCPQNTGDRCVSHLVSCESARSQWSPQQPISTVGPRSLQFTYHQSLLLGGIGHRTGHTHRKRKRSSKTATHTEHACSQEHVNGAGPCSYIDPCIHQQQKQRASLQVTMPRGTSHHATGPAPTVNNIKSLHVRWPAARHSFAHSGSVRPHRLRRPVVLSITAGHVHALEGRARRAWHALYC